MSGSPERSYILWFSQRVGSTLLAQTLEDTGIAGRPREWFSNDRPTREQLWRDATTPNGVLAIKYGMSDAHAELTATLGRAHASGPDPDGGRAWDAWFPRCKHVVMTRRDRVRLAISWWRAIQSQEWHRPSRAAPTAVEPPSSSPPAELRYDRGAIDQLVIEADQREAAIHAQLARWNVAPFTIVYEDMIASYERTVRDVLDFVGVPGREGLAIPAPALARLADDLSEAWYQRYLHDGG
jgi:trehalose 2-sulfotransferase